METIAPIEIAAQQVMHSERIANALAIIEQRPRYGVLQIPMWVSLVTLFCLSITSILNPLFNASYALSTVLMMIIASVAVNAIATQRRLEALIVLVKSEIEK